MKVTDSGPSGGIDWAFAFDAAARAARQDNASKVLAVIVPSVHCPTQVSSVGGLQERVETIGKFTNVTAANRLFSLDGRVALITGASRGLGLAMAEGLAEAGATVVANGRSDDTLETVACALRERGLKG